MKHDIDYSLRVAYFSGFVGTLEDYDGRFTRFHGKEVKEQLDCEVEECLNQDH